MNYIVSKSSGKAEYRIYKEGEEIEGYPIYSGHKLAVDSNLLAEILDYRIEKSTGKINFLRYDKVISEHNHLDLTLWDVGKKESIEKNLFDSWISLNQKMKFDLGEYRKIVVTRVNI